MSTSVGTDLKGKYNHSLMIESVGEPSDFEGRMMVMEKGLNLFGRIPFVSNLSAIGRAWTGGLEMLKGQVSLFSQAPSLVCSHFQGQESLIQESQKKALNALKISAHGAANLNRAAIESIPFWGNAACFAYDHCNLRLKYDEFDGSSSRNALTVDEKNEVQDESIIQHSAQPNIVFLSCHGGNGHESAKAFLEDRLKERFNCRTIYPLKSFLSIVDSEKIYNFLLRNGLNRLTNYLAGSFLTSCLISISENRVSQLMEKTIRDQHPTYVVSLVPMVNHITMKVCSNHEIPYLLVTLDADLTNWTIGLEQVASLAGKVQYTIGYDLPTTGEMLLKKGIRPENLHTIGFPIRKEFCEEKPQREDLCAEIGLPQDRQIVLIMAGGSGGEYAYRIAKILARQPFNLCLVVIAGKNEALRQKVTALSVDQSNSLIALGFSKRVSDYMRVSHLLITKPGPSTVAEAAEIYRRYQTPFVLLYDKDCLFWEKPNIQIAKEGGFGEPFMTDEELVEMVKDRLKEDNPPITAKISKNCFFDRAVKILDE